MRGRDIRSINRRLPLGGARRRVRADSYTRGFLCVASIERRSFNCPYIPGFLARLKKKGYRQTTLLSMVDVVGTGTSNCGLAIADAGINMRAGINNLSLLVMRLPYDGDCSDASINRTVMFMVTFFGTSKMKRNS